MTKICNFAKAWLYLRFHWQTKIMKKNCTLRKNWPKYLFQGICLAASAFTAIYLINYDTFDISNSIHSFGGYIVGTSLNETLESVNLLKCAAIALLLIVFGKLFCGFICPLGTVQDLLIQLRRALNFSSIHIKQNSTADRILRLIKYLILLWILLYSAGESDLIDNNHSIRTMIIEWGGIILLVIVVFLSLFINRFWCKYLCPAAVVFNSFKFWLWTLLLLFGFWFLSLLGLSINWMAILCSTLTLGYLLEVFRGKPTVQLMSVRKDFTYCSGCGVCEKSCPYGIQIKKSKEIINHIDCSSCGDCISTCRTRALSIGNSGNPSSRFIPLVPAILIVTVFLGIIVSNRIPFIDETWGMDGTASMETVKIDNFYPLDDHDSIHAMKDKLQAIPGLHGIKAYSKGKLLELTFDPNAISQSDIKRSLFTPCSVSVRNPDPAGQYTISRYCLRMDHIYDGSEMMTLGNVLTESGIETFGIITEYDDPVRVHIFIKSNDNIDSELFHHIFDRNSSYYINGKSVHTHFRFISLEKVYKNTSIKDYIRMMFVPFSYEIVGSYVDENGDSYEEGRDIHFAGMPQNLLEMASTHFNDDSVRSSIPQLIKKLSKEDGTISIYIRLNKQLIPSLYIRYASTMSTDGIYALLEGFCNENGMDYSPETLKISPFTSIPE